MKYLLKFSKFSLPITLPKKCVLQCRSVFSKHFSNSVLPNLAFSFGDKVAIVDSDGSHTYKDLFLSSQKLKEILKNHYSMSNKDQIAFLTSNNALYTICQWAIWLNGSIGVPLSPFHPQSEIEYILKNSQSSMVISSPDFFDVVYHSTNKLNILHFPIPKKFLVSSSDKLLKNHSVQDSGLIIYTSGTTGRPKGVVHTNATLNAQVKNIVEEYKICSSDVALHVLPLHHIHGIVNTLMCPLTCGATVVMENKFSPEKVWNHLLQNTDPPINIFMAVPTIYTKLIDYFDKNNMCTQETVEKCQHIRLMISGSSALPVSVLNKWKDITGHVLLERYGMTEIGMCFTNPYYGKRTPGAVGLPFQNVSVLIVPNNADGSIDLNNAVVRADKQSVEITSGCHGEQGEVLVKSPCVFSHYFDNSKATAESFVDGWFRTGDTAVYQNGVFRIVGRTSVDIIKSGGYKISALDIEQHLLNHPSIREVCVVGVPDSVWGEHVSALLSFNKGCNISLQDIQDWCRNRMPSYQIPKTIATCKNLPRNAMGKVNKKEIIEVFFKNKSSINK